MPFLDELEWVLIEPTMQHGKQPILEYREKHGCDLKTARENVRTKPMEAFLEITGVDNIHWDVIHHHRLKDWGEECSDCGHLFRTPTANFCVSCGKRAAVQRA